MCGLPDRFPAFCGQTAGKGFLNLARPEPEVKLNAAVSPCFCRTAPDATRQPIDQKSANELDQELDEEVDKHSGS
jgi:hypothetical protein